MFMWLLVLAIGVLSLGLTGWLHRYALAHSVVDVPNERSSHSTPTPRGGGVAIVVTFLLGVAVLKVAGYLPASLFGALVGAGAWVALLGWEDDRRNLPVHLRLAGHFIGAAWAVFWLGGLPPLPVFGHVVYLGWIGHCLAAFYLVWLLNLYNFMDGIDGIAGIEAVTVCFGGVILCALSPAGKALWVVPVLVAAATVGFLFWNFPRARIFMGDAGSGFLGLVLGVLSIRAGWDLPELLGGWVILLGTFVVDATVTLLRRAWRGEKVYEAHRNHAYQHAAQIYGHPPVSLAYGAINMLWLFPVATLVAARVLDCSLGVIIAYVPLVLAALWFGGGVSVDE